MVWCAGDVVWRAALWCGGKEKVIHVVACCASGCGGDKNGG